VHRTQLYLDDQVWSALRIRARDEKTTISELVRQAVRERYAGVLGCQKQAMEEFVGSAKRRGPGEDATEYVRRLRRSTRPSRLEAQ
jgi:hypothetical protein